MNRFEAFTKDDLAKMLEACIPEIESKQGTKLSNVGLLMRIIGESTHNNSLMAFAIPLNNLGVYLGWFYTGPAMAMLSPEARKVYQRLVDDSSKEGVRLVRKVKDVLCVNGSDNAEETLNLLGELDALWLRLNDAVVLLQGAASSQQQQ